MDVNRYRGILDEFKRIGRAVYRTGLNNSHSGNMSFRVGDRLLITRRGSMIGFLEDSDIIETGMEENDSGIALASTETYVHRAILQGTSGLSVMHTHPIHAVALSFVQDEIIPIDVEGSYYLRRVPVLAFEFGTSSKEMAEELPKALKSYRIAVVKGHGAFAVGNSLDEVLHLSHMLENIAQILCTVKAIGGDVAKIQQAQYSKW